MAQDQDSVKTDVDSLLELLKQNEKLSMSDAAKKLGLKEDTVKMWVDFLVEEKVVGVEYKFTKPYIYLNKPKEEKKGRIIKEQEIGLDNFKQDFKQRAEKSNISQQQASFLWKDHILNQLELEKPFFYREAKKRGLKHIEHLWEAYRRELTKKE